MSALHHLVRVVTHFETGEILRCVSAGAVSGALGATTAGEHVAVVLVGSSASSSCSASLRASSSALRRSSARRRFSSSRLLFTHAVRSSSPSPASPSCLVERSRASISRRSLAAAIRAEISAVCFAFASSARGVRRLLRLALRLGAVALAGAQRLQTELLAHAIGLLEGHRNLAARLVGADVEALGERLVILTHDGALHDVGKAVEMDRARTTVRSDRRRRDERACRALECSSPSSPPASPFPFQRELAGEAGQILDFQNAESEVARHLTVVVAGQRPVMGEGEGSRARGGVASTSCDAFIAEHLLVYATARWHYVVAGSGDKSRWRILKISHEESPAGRGLVVAEDRTEYDEGSARASSPQ